MEQKLAYFLKLTDSLRQQAHNPGMAIAILHDKKLVYKGGLGYRDVAKQLPVTDNTLFEIGSCTKAFAGVIAAQLVQEGVLSWDDKVRRHLPEFTLADAYATQNATLQDIFTHRVGLDQHYYLLYGPAFTGKEVLTKLPFLSFNGTFREKFLYNNLLYMVAGILAERATATPWEELVRRRIFQPLGMHASFATSQEFLQYAEHTLSYRNDGKTIVPHTNLDASGAAGSISSTITDMATWLSMLVNKGALGSQPFLSPQQFAYLTSPLTVRNAAEEIFYGIGWDVDTKRNIIYHDGRTAGQSSRILLMPQNGFGIVIMCNQQTELQNLLIRYATNIFVDDNYARMTDFEQFVIAKANKANVKELLTPLPIQDKTALALLPACTGEYVHPAYGTITLTQPAANQLHFQYYGFQGFAQHHHNHHFTALTTHDTGRDKFDFTVLQDAQHRVTGLEVVLPFTKPLRFEKVPANKALPKARKPLGR
ncbi:beta-lactamase family protein [Hymenobacter sp. 5516J-16]|uniref:serine hydrolase domain-containing protein n=1 Tax=Hymenobacter sp. 5516J-16 TaxID=2932253 RepID=UPI001FD3CDB1|nr:beta-lactamase family protein [Hymenobacter sp. 5516J-16]UOQ77767.1 beta-lactamase family protein [Hymenobacter sp. 5516J-16]